MAAIHERPHKRLVHEMLDEAFEKRKARGPLPPHFNFAPGTVIHVDDPTVFAAGDLIEFETTAERVRVREIPASWYNGREAPRLAPPSLQVRALRWLAPRVAYLRQHGRKLLPGLVQRTLWSIAGLELGALLGLGAFGA